MKCKCGNEYESWSESECSICAFKKVRADHEKMWTYICKAGIKKQPDMYILKEVAIRKVTDRYVINNCFLCDVAIKYLTGCETCPLYVVTGYKCGHTFSKFASAIGAYKTYTSEKINPMAKYGIDMPKRDLRQEFLAFAEDIRDVYKELDKIVKPELIKKHEAMWDFILEGLVKYRHFNQLKKAAMGDVEINCFLCAEYKKGENCDGCPLVVKYGRSCDDYGSEFFKVLENFEACQLGNQKACGRFFYWARKIRNCCQ